MAELQKGIEMLFPLKDSLIKLKPALLIFFTLATLAILVLSKPLQCYWSTDLLTALATWIGGGVITSLIARAITRDFAPVILLAVIAAILCLGAGPLPSLCTLLFGLASYTGGRLLLHSALPVHNAQPLWIAASATGASLLLAVITVSLHFPVSYRLSYLLIALAPIALYFGSRARCHFFSQHSQQLFAAFRAQINSLSYWQFCTLAVLAGFIASFVFVPSVMHDDHILHLSVWTQVKYQHQFHFDIGLQRWSLAPLAFDGLHAFISLLAGSDARPAMNLALLALIVITLWKLTGIAGANPLGKLLSVLLFLSTPMLANLLLSLQTELVLALLTTLGVYLLLEKSQDISLRTLSLFLVCCLLGAIKLPAWFLAGTFGFLWLSIYRDELLTLKKQLNPTLLLCMGIGIFISLHSYLNAYLHTGNPLYPLFNSYFNPGSGMQDISESPFIGKPGWKAYLGFFFDSSHYFESQNFIAGFQYMVLPVLGFVYCYLVNGRAVALCLGLPIIVFGSAMFIQMQYWRYFFPLLPIACVLIISLLPTATIAKRIGVSVLSIYLLLNLFYLPGVSWLFYGNHLLNISSSGKAIFEEKHMPELALNRYVNQQYPNSSVLLAIGRPYGATLGGKPVYAARATPSVFETFKQMPNSDALLEYMRQNNITIVYLNDADSHDRFAFQPMIRDLVAKHGIKEKTQGQVSLYKLNL